MSAARTARRRRSQMRLDKRYRPQNQPGALMKGAPAKPAKPTKRGGGK